MNVVAAQGSTGHIVHPWGTEEAHHQLSRGVAVEMSGITKAFGSTVANRDANLSVHFNEVHALLGANGAGKTTLMNILFGFLSPDAGTVSFEGLEVEIRSPREALALGIGMVRQHFALVPQLNVAENVILGTNPASLRRVQLKELGRSIGKLATDNGMDLDPFRRVEQLDVDQQQAVEILKLLYRGAKVLLLDEPTASLGPAQVHRLFETLSELRRGGRAVVIITHKLAEVMQLADRATVMRAGSTVVSLGRDKFNEEELTRQMIGELDLRDDVADLEISGSILVEASEVMPVAGHVQSVSSATVELASDTGSKRFPLQVRGLTVVGDQGGLAVDGLDFAIEAGMILGLTGVEGNGQRELVEALAGIRAWAGGSVWVDGIRVERPTPAKMRAAGLGIVSEDRLRWDVVPELSVMENLSLADIAGGRLSHRGVLQRSELARRAELLIAEYDIRPTDPNVALKHLSGGNQQKVVIARELARGPAALVASQPTRGLDIRATQAVHDRIRWLRSEGKCVLLVTLDLDELFALSDRVIVLYRGRATYQSSRAAIDLQQLSSAMAGIGV